MPLTQKGAKIVEPSLRSKYIESLCDVITGRLYGQRVALHPECAKLICAKRCI